MIPPSDEKLDKVIDSIIEIAKNSAQEPKYDPDDLCVVYNYSREQTIRGELREALRDLFTKERSE